MTRKLGMGRGVAKQSMGDQWKVAVWGPGYGWHQAGSNALIGD